MKRRRADGRRGTMRCEEGALMWTRGSLTYTQHTEIKLIFTSGFYYCNRANKSRTSNNNTESETHLP